VSPLLVLLQVGTFALVGASLALATYAVMSAPSMPPERLGLRGHKRTLARRDNPLFAQIEPVMRWLSTRISGLVAPDLRAHLNQQITRAGDLWGLQAEDIVSLSGLSAAAACGLGAAYSLYTDSGYLFAVVAVVLGAIMPYLQLASTAQKRVRSVQKALPHVMDLMVLGLGAGLDFTGAVRQVIDKAGTADEPLVEELRLLLQELKLGRTRRQALAQFAERAPCDAVRDLVAAVTQSEEQGTPLAAVLAAQAQSSRMRRSVQAEESAAKASTSLMIPLGLLFISVLLLIVSPMVLTLGANF
jgi:tight adherence protein C